MKVFRIFTIIFFIAGNIFSQQKYLIPQKSISGKWGAVDVNHKEIISFNYDNVSFYSFGLYLVDLNGKKGLYNSEGKQVLEANYDVVKPLSNSLFQVYINGKTGVVDYRGNEILPIEFKTVLYRKGRGNFIVSKNSKYSTYNLTGQKQTLFYSDNISFYGDKYFLFQMKNKFAVSKNIQDISRLTFYDDIVKGEGYFLVRKKSKWGVLDKNCKRIIKSKYEGINKELGNNKYYEVEKDGLFAFFNLKGKKITSFEFNYPMYFFRGDIVWTKNNQGWYRYDLKTNKEQTLDFTKLIDTISGFTRVVRDNYVELIDENEDVFFRGKYNNVIPLNKTLFKVQFMRKWGVVNIKGDIVIDIIYDDIIFNSIPKKVDLSVSRFALEEEKNIKKLYTETFTTRLNGKEGLFSLEGKEIVPVVYNNVDASVYNQFFITDNKGKFNAYNRQGVIVFENDFRSLTWNDNQKMFTIVTDTSMAVSDTLGKIIQLKEVNNFRWSNKKGLFFNKNKNREGVLNLKLDTLIDFKYNEVYDLNKELFVAVADSASYIFNAKGIKILNSKIETIELIDASEEGLLIIGKDNMLGVVNYNGQIIIPFEFERIIFDEEHSLFKVYSESVFIGYISLSGEKYF